MGRVLCHLNSPGNPLWGLRLSPAFVDVYVPPEIGTLDIHGKPRLKVQWCFIWALEDDYLDFRIFFETLAHLRFALFPNSSFIPLSLMGFYM